MREEVIYKEQPLVSVIIPVYNRMNTILGTVESVLNQSYKNIEIIVIDDGSSDDTLNVLKNIKNEKLQVLEQDHKGANFARNFGIKKAKGEYIALIDSADKWDDRKIEKQVECLQKDPQLDMVFCVEKTNSADGTNVSPSLAQQRILKEGFLKEILAKGNCIDTSTILCKYRCFEIVGLFDVNLSRCQEYEWVLRVVQKCSIYFLNECLVEANIRKDSISLDISKLLHSIPQIYNKHRNYFAQYGTEIDILMIPIWEMYKREKGFYDYMKYFSLLDKYLDIQWESKKKEVYMVTFKLIFSQSVKWQYIIQNMQEECNIKKLLEKKIRFNILGAGEIAKRFYAYLQSLGLEKLIGHVIVTSVKSNQQFDEAISMIELKQCTESLKDMPLVLAVNSFNMLEVIEKLKEMEFQRIVMLSEEGQTWY